MYYIVFKYNSNVSFEYNEYSSWTNTPLLYSQSTSSLTMIMEQ
jgi:hypothetical protein